MVYSSDFEGDYESDDDHCTYRPGKSVSSERRSFTVLCSVCWCWWNTLSGWPESPTGQWVRHQLRKLIERECTVQTEIPSISQCVTCVVSRFDHERA